MSVMSIMSTTILFKFPNLVLKTLLVSVPCSLHHSPQSLLLLLSKELSPWHVTPWHLTHVLTPLLQACRENHVDVVALLLHNGCSVNANFPNSRENPLTLASEKGYFFSLFTLSYWPEVGFWPGPGWLYFGWGRDLADLGIWPSRDFINSFLSKVHEW